MESTRQGNWSRGFPGPRVVVRSSWFKRREHQILRVASMGLQKPQPTWPPIQALACLSSSLITSPHPTILDSCAYPVHHLNDQHRTIKHWLSLTELWH